jgi:endonuclease YncB( thermonuclease family)
MKGLFIYIAPMWSVLLYVLIACVHPSSEEVKGKVVKVVDGDTFDILDSGQRVHRIRMNGIDAPEKGQAFGDASKKKLASFCAGKMVKIVKYSTDRNGRWIADSYVDGVSLSAAMVRDGMAWHFVKYTSDSTLARLEKEARTQKRGLWADPQAIATWIYRSKRLRD